VEEKLICKMSLYALSTNGKVSCGMIQDIGVDLSPWFQGTYDGKFSPPFPSPSFLSPPSP